MPYPIVRDLKEAAEFEAHCFCKSYSEENEQTIKCNVCGGSQKLGL